MMTNTLKRCYLPLLVAASIGAAAAAPTSPQVVAGQATFSQQGNVFSITNTPNTIINWQGFSIDQGEIARFIQQGPDSAVLNRIVGQDPSRILGALQSNGKVFLINPNGILFGKGARVDVNGLVASTLDIANADFLAGKKTFTAGPVAGDIENAGAITTGSGGQVFLLGSNVGNSGVITSPQGDVVLAAGHSVKLVDSRDPDLHVVVSAPTHQSLNLGQVIAQGGKVGIYGALVNQRGVVNADSAVVGANGKIVLRASRDTLLEQGSVTSATGAGTGGEIHVLGERVGITGNARVDASGAKGGGTVLVGGDYQGKNGLLPNAQQAWFGSGASIRADALAGGDGGKVVLWSNGATGAYGSISARGAGAGAGGQVETSGHYLDVAGIRVDAGGGGKRGNWLLDPYDIQVVGGGTASAGDAAAFGNGSATGVTRVAPSTLAATGADIVLQAQHDLIITDAINSAYNVTAQAGNDIHVDAAVRTTGGNLDFRAANAIVLSAGGKLQGGNYIDLKANSMALAGTIEGAGGQLPVVSFTTNDASRGITVAKSNPEDAMWLDAQALARLSAYEINIGNAAHTGTIRVASALATPASLVLENAGTIAIDAPVQLTGGASQFIASLHTPWGSPAGGISIGAAGSVSAGQSVLLQGDRLAIGGAVSAPSVTLRPHSAQASIALGSSGDGTTLGLTNDALGHIATASLAIGGLPGQMGQLRVMQAIDLRGANGGPGKVTLDAGDAELRLDASFAAAEVALKSNAAILENDGGAVVADRLSVQGGDVMLGGANRIGVVAGATSGRVFNLNASGKLTVGAAGALSGIDAPNAEVRVVVDDGALTVDRAIGGGDAVSLEANGIRGGATISAASIDLRSSAGIGSASAPLSTRTHSLSAYNQGQGANPINIRNTGELVLVKAVQDGPGNGGAIAIDNTGGLTVPGYAGGDGAEAGVVRTSSGNIALTTHSPLSIDGRVTTDSGNISLTADNGGALTVSPGARVASGSGEVTVVAGSTSIAEGTISVSNPGKLHLPSREPPSLESCLGNGSLAGCDAVLAAALEECSANPDGANCERILPSLQTCQITPTAPGCAVVLARAALQACVAHPDGAGCDKVLPTYAQCEATPSRTGCEPVIAAHAALVACIADPSEAGCEQVLPKYETCQANPSALGCDTVVALRNALLACIADPSGAACEQTLPKYETCQANPSRLGCDTVVAQRQALLACIANPSGAACEQTLPKYETCQANPSRLGCDTVVAQRQALLACIANPSGAGCEQTLPKYESCQANPSRLGCDTVVAQRQALLACIANPQGAGCEQTLPRYESCQATPSALGCDTVLSRRAQLLACIATPTASGCDKVLPPLAACRNDSTLLGCVPVLARASFEACLANPGAPGCVAILPSLPSCKVNGAQEGCPQVLQVAWDFCMAHPNDASCSGILPTLGQCVADKSAPGCSVVLPSFEQCVGSPTLQGCQVVLPTLAQCAAAPTTAGCAAVLPAPSFCSTHPADASCQAFNPGASPGAQGGQLAQAVQATVNLINTGAPKPATGGGTPAQGSPGKPEDKKAGPAPSENSGVKNEKPATKTYCN
jgi:filamentous hemagglutinin family protein